MKKILITTVAAAAMVLGTVTTASADVSEQQEFQCSPGILGTGILCNQAPLPGPAPEDDVFQGTPLGADSPLLDVLKGLVG